VRLLSTYVLALFLLTTAEPDQMHMHNGLKIMFEEYIYFSKLTRVEERSQERVLPKVKRAVLNTITNRFKTNKPEAITQQPSGYATDEKGGGTTTVNVPFDAFNNLTYSHPSEVSDAEWKALSRGVRTVGWNTCFYLITSDIIGPFRIPHVFQVIYPIIKQSLLTALDGLSHN
jgi:hypothetical protein